MSINDMVNVEVTITLNYPIPADLDERDKWYGTTDISECVKADFDNDPAAFLLEANITDLQIAGEPS